MNGSPVLKTPSNDVTLSCPRCKGFRMPEWYYDHQESAVPPWVYSLKCINCGFVEDPVIFKHHRLVHLPTPRRQLPGNRVGVKQTLRNRLKKNQRRLPI